MTRSLLASLAAPLSRTPDERCPSRLLLGMEWRAALEWVCVPWAMPWLLGAVPRGDGHTVMLLPGLLAGDRSAASLQRFLRSRGYTVQGWEQGANVGPREGLMERLQDKLADLHETSGRKVSLIGHSLGGIFARELARAEPGRVRQVITLGSPLYGQPEASTNAWALYCAVNRDPASHVHARGDEAPPVPTTSIYSRYDGVVGWGCSVERQGPFTDNIEINSASHLGLAVNPLVWYAVGDRLAQREEGWSHFAPRALNKYLFPSRAPRRD